MNIIITGSLGRISKPLTERLVKEGHTVTVISSRPEMHAAITATGAMPAIGTLEDVDFLVSVFKHADALYCMTPPNHSGDVNYPEFNRRISQNYARAIRESGVNRIVHLSSYGAHLPSGTGFIMGKHYAENILNELEGVNITHMRPVYFYYNFYNMINMIKKTGVIRANYGGAHKFAIVSPDDIAAAVATEIIKPGVAGHTIQYVASDERSGDEIAAILGAAIGQPDLKWVLITDEEMKNGLLANGFAPHVAEQMTEMYAALHAGLLEEEYVLDKPEMGGVKFEVFAAAFAERFNN